MGDKLYLVTEADLFSFFNSRARVANALMDAVKEMDDQWAGAEAWVQSLITMLNSYTMLADSHEWYATHHAKCEDICGAECVPSEDEVRIFQESNHEIKPWREE